MLGTSRVVATVLASVLLVSPALAQPTAQQKQQAGDLVKQAIAKSQAKEHDAAIELYLKAYGIIPHAQLLSNIGTEYQNAQKPVEALKYFCMYLEKDPAGPLVGYATAQAKALYFQLGNKTVDDKDVCKAPVEPQAPAAPVEPATTTGTQHIETMPAETQDPGKTFKLAGIALGGAGLIAVGAGLYFGSEAQKISDTITNWDTETPWRADIKDYEARGARYEKLQIGMLIGGGVAVIGGAALYFLGRNKTEGAEHVSVQPTASADGAGVVVSGAF